MKKLLAMLLSVAMVMTMLTIPAVAETTVGNLTIKLNTPTSNGGLFGKGDDEYASSMTSDSSSSDAKALFIVTCSADFDFSDKKYTIMDLNVAPNSAATSISAGPNAGLFPVKTTDFHINRWNSVRVVIEEKTAAEMQELNTYQPYTLYVNGEKVAEGASKLAGGDVTSVGTAAYGKGFRFNIMGPAKTALGYVADIKLSSSDENEAPVMANLTAGTTYTVDNNSIISDGTVTLADIIAQNSEYTISAFSNDSFTDKLSNDAVLTTGNIIMAKTSEGTYSYYNVTDSNTNLLFSSTNGTLPADHLFKATQQTVSGTYGKAPDNQVLKLTASSETDGNIMFQQQSVYTATKNYFVIEGSILPVGGEVRMKTVSLHTNNETTGHAVVGQALGTFVPDTWNKFLTYVDFTGDTPVAYSYLNGALVKENDAEPAFGVDNSNIRFCFNSGVAGEVFELYMDDFCYYETNALPMGIEATRLPTIANGNGYSISNGRLCTTGEATVAQLKAAADNVRVFTDSTSSTLAQDTDVLTEGMLVAVENSYNTIASYPVAISYGETEIDLRTDTFPTVANGTGATVDGFAGKDASDKVLAVTANTDTHIALKSWGTVVKTGSDNSVTPSWNKSDYNGYLVVEASIYNVDNTVIALVTTQTGQVSGNVASFIPENQWSRIKFVYNAVDGDANEGKTMTYVDGKPITGWTASKFGALAAYSTNNYMCNDIRISMKGSTSGQPATYIDDIRVYEAASLRAEEELTFNAPEGTTKNNYQFAYASGTTITAGDITALNPDVRIFNSTSDYTEITDSSAVLSNGNVIFASGTSKSATEANISYKDLYMVLTVGEMAPTKDVLNGLPASLYRGTVSEAANGAFENTASVTLITDTNTSDSNWYTAKGFSGLSAGMNYLVWEVDFAPDDKVKAMYFGANQHAALATSLKVGEHIRANRWNKVVMVYDIEADTSDLYVNGALVSEDFDGNYAEKFSGSIDLRFVVDCAVGSNSYIDTFKIYESVMYPEIPSAVSLEEGYNSKILVNNATYSANINISITLDEVAALCEGNDVYAFTDNTFSSTLSGDDTFTDGNILAIHTPDNLFTTYSVITHDSDTILVAGDTYSGDGQMTTGILGIYAPVTEGATLVAVQYDESGSIVKIDANSTPVNNVLSVNFETEEVDKSTIKAMLIKDIASLKPICTPVEIGVRDYIDFLILGNSYSMDLTWHLRQIAAADDVLMNISVLNKGGCHLEYHYENREGNAAELGINFWRNNEVKGTIYNLEQVLENFDWDYVAIQASSTTQGLDNPSEENYQENWAVSVPFAQYIHEKEPNARLVLHSTWSMENGYNYIYDVETRDTVLQNMKTLNERCAQEINATLGLEGDDAVMIISSSDVIHAARYYTPAQDVTINDRTCSAGTMLFDTTYYKDGHIFSAKEVDVGDGSMLLSEADFNAGKISLHRDGFHMSAVGRYLIALNAYKTITGNAVTGNTFDSYDATGNEGKIRLDSSPGGYHVTETDKGELSGTVYQTYDILSPEVRSVCQEIVDSLE